MRIAFVVGEFPRLSETFILNQITGLLTRGHAVTVWAGRPGRQDKRHADVERYRLLEKTRYWPELTGRWSDRLRLAAAIAGRPGRGLDRAGLWRRLLSPRSGAAAGAGAPAAGWDAVIAHFGHVGLETLRLREQGALPGGLVTCFHAYDMSVIFGERGERVYERLFRQGQLFLPVSRLWQQRLIALGCPPERTAVHRMGIDCSRFRFAGRAPEPGGTIRLASVARLVEKKGLAYSLEALSRVVQRHPALEYTIIGDGPLRRDLEALSGRLGLTRHVRFAGWMEQEGIIAALDRMHLFLAPSLTAANGDAEGIPVALLEAMASGMPVLSTTHSGIPELVADGVSGFLAPEGDAEALAGRLRLLLESPGAWPAMGRAGRERVEREFDIERLNDRLVERLREAAASRGRRVSEGCGPAPPD